MTVNPYATTSGPVSVLPSRAPSPQLDLSTNPDSILASLPGSGTFGSSLDLSLRDLSLDGGPLPKSHSSPSLPGPLLEPPTPTSPTEAERPSLVAPSQGQGPGSSSTTSQSGISPTRHPLIRSVTAPIEAVAPLAVEHSLSPPLSAVPSVARKAAPTRSVTASLEGGPAPPPAQSEGDKSTERKNTAAGLLRKAMTTGPHSLAKPGEESEKGAEQPKPAPLVLEKMSVYETKTASRRCYQYQSNSFAQADVVAG